MLGGSMKLPSSSRGSRNVPIDPRLHLGWRHVVVGLESPREVERIVETDGAGGLLNSGILLDQPPFGLTHLDGQNQLPRGAAECGGETTLERSQRDIESIGEIGRGERL